MRPFQNLPLPPRIYLSFPQIYATLSECTPPEVSRCDTPRIYPSLPKYTAPFLQLAFMRGSQNLPLPARKLQPSFYN